MSGLKRGSGPSLLVLLAVAVVVGAVGLQLDGYWQYVATLGAIQAIVGLSIGVVFGQAGMLSLCQLSLSAVGAWTVAYVSADLDIVPVPWSILVGAAVAVPVGVLISLPALRLRRVNLALVTLGFVVLIYTVAQAGKVPGTQLTLFVELPSWMSDSGLFLVSWVSFVLLAAATIVVRASRWGLSWLAIARSERATAAMGVSVLKAKVTAFGVSAFIAGWAGGLTVASYGSPDPAPYSPLASLTLFVLAVMMGAGFWEGALALGVFGAASTALLREFNLSPDIGILLFAIGAIQVLSDENGGFSALLRRGIARVAARRGRSSAVPVAAFRSGDTPVLTAVEVDDGPPALLIEDLTVRYGAVVALDSVTLEVPARRVVGLVGPNGAGKSTLVDAATGFLASYSGSVMVDGTSMDALSAHGRAAYMRRTFQQDRTIGELRPQDYLKLSAPRGTPPERLAEILEFVGCTETETQIHSLDVRTRRLLMIASCLAGSPRVVLVDEPAAGLAADESLDLAARLTEIPARFNCAVLVIEHDMDLVRQACSTIVVLDFGKVLSHGDTATVLADPAVAAAYLGDELVARDA